MVTTRTETATVTTNHNKPFVVRDPMEVRNEIKDRLVKKWTDKQKEEVSDWNANNLDKDSKTEMEIEVGIYDYGGPYGEHPIEWETAQTLSFIKKLPNFDLPPIRGLCFCPFSTRHNGEDWLHTNRVSTHLESLYYCTAEPFNDRRSFMDHLRQKTSRGNNGHRYLKHYLNELQTA
jgi:hypothetical protein